MKNKSHGVWAPNHANSGFDGDGSFNFIHTDEDGNLRVKVLYFNPSTLSWEAATGPTIAGSATGIGDSSGIVPSDETVLVYEGGTTIYVCKAAVGSSASSSVWQIKKIDASSGVVITWCDGNTMYDNTATDLLTVSGHSYS